MRVSFRTLLVTGLAVSVLLGLGISPLASGAPDGLERVAEAQGFAETAGEHGLAGSPLAGYRLEGFGDEGLGTGLAGVIGVLTTFGLGYGLFAVLRTRSQSAGR